MATILVVDDDGSALEALTAIVRVGGHDVVAAHCAAAALQIIRSDLPLDLLLTSVGIVDVGCFRLARMARARRQDLKVLYLSGFWDAPEITSDRGERYGTLLKKPILPIELRNEITSALAC